MVGFPFIRKRIVYKLFCKEDDEGKGWTLIDEREDFISSSDATEIYGDDCVRLRLEEWDVNKNKRIRTRWVTRKKEKKEPPTILDLMTEYAMLNNAMGNIMKTYIETLKSYADMIKSLGGLKSSESGEKSPFDDFLKTLLESSLKSRLGSVNVQNAQQSVPQASQPVDRDFLMRIKEMAEKDLRDIENAPCGKKGEGEACLEGGETVEEEGE